MAISSAVIKIKADIEEKITKELEEISKEKSLKKEVTQILVLKMKIQNMKK